MNLLDIKDCPISNDALDSLLRLLFEGQKRGQSTGVSYYPYFETADLKWEAVIHHQLTSCILKTGSTLEEAIGRVFMKLQEYDKQQAELAT